MNPPENIVLFAKGDAEKSIVQLVESQINVKATDTLSNISTDALVLQIDANGLALVENEHVLRGDFARMLPRLVPNNLNHELLVRAAKLKGVPGTLTAVDATAGLGEDAFLLAAAGFHVRLFERDPVIAALLDDALRRGTRNPDLAPIIHRMELVMADSIEMLPQLNPPPDIILLDPMFPQRQKSGLIKKKFQLLHRLELPCTEENALLDAASMCGPRRIVIKRPLKGPYLAGRKPSYSIKGNSIRYDCIVCQKGS